jgi:F0F1-type ATP synthase assembly protein I
MKKDLSSSLKFYAKYSSMGIQMLVIILIGVFGGYELDKLVKGNLPYFTVSLSIISVFIAIYLAVKDLLRTKKK